jgi:hypothetical protein
MYVWVEQAAQTVRLVTIKYAPIMAFFMVSPLNKVVAEPTLTLQKI